MKKEIFAGKTIAVIGAGNMGEALIRGLIQNQVVAASQVIASEPVEKRREYIHQTYGIQLLADNIALVKQGDVLILAVKPQVTPAVLKEIGPFLGPSKLLISVVAGVAIRTLSRFIKEGTRIIRTMPNTPVMVMGGAICLAPGSHVPAQDLALAQAIFESVGKTEIIEEKLMDCATGLVGSGPAYVFVLIEALADGAVRMGMSREVAQNLAAQVVYGSAKMVLESKMHPGQLKDRVASPGGTTIEGLHQLEKGAFRATLMNAVEAATRRSEALGRLSESDSEQGKS
jgi:pyrroline-5-carboxylate reductase